MKIFPNAEKSFASVKDLLSRCHEPDIYYARDLDNALRNTTTKRLPDIWNSLEILGRDYRGVRLTSEVMHTTWQHG